MSDPWSYDRSHDGPAGLLQDRAGFFHKNKLASAPWRWAAGFIDWGIVFGMPNYFVYAVTGSDVLGLWIGLAIAGLNSGYLAARTTQSLGKRICGMNLVQVRENTKAESFVCYVPVWVALLRMFLHYPFDFIPLAIGFWLVPITSKGRGTISDYVCRTIVYRDPNLPKPIAWQGGRRDWP